MKHKLRRMVFLMAALLMMIGPTHAKPIIQMEQGRLVVGQEKKRTPQTTELQNTPLAGNSEALKISRDSWLDGQIAAPAQFDKGTISFWLHPLDWDKGAGWRVLFNWRSLLNGKAAESDSLWVRVDDKNNLIFMLGDFSNKKWDLLLVPLPQADKPQWTHLALVWNADELQAYADGERIGQKARVYKQPLSLGRDFRFGGPHGSGTEQGSAALALFEADDEMWDAKQIREKIKAQQKLVTEVTAPVNNPTPATPQNTDWLAPEFGATAYASSFSLELDPRQVIQRKPDAQWKPNANDKNPRFYIALPGAVVFDQLRLKGEVPPSVRVFAGDSRLDMKLQAAQVKQENDGATLTLQKPVCARVLELRFTPGTPVLLQQVSARAADSALVTAQTIVLKKGEPITATLKAGARVRFDVDAALLPNAPDATWLLEVEQKAAENFRKYQDYRAARALVSRVDNRAAATADITQYSVSGEYGIYLSQLNNNATRTELGTIQVQGQSLPDWSQQKQPGFPTVRLDLESHRLPHIVVGNQSIPAVIMVMGAPSFEKITAYKKTGARLRRFNTTGSSLVDSPDIEQNVAATLAEIEQNAKNILALAPDTYLMIGLDTRPRAAWLKQYGGDTLNRTSNGTMGSGVNFGSDQLRRDLQKATRLLVEALAKKPYADRIIALQPYFGRGGDGWGYGIDQAGWTGRDKIMLGDYAPAEEAGFDKWLESKYGAPLETTLKGKWPAEALASSRRVPSDARLASVDHGLFIDPVQKRDVADYWEYRGLSVVDTVLEVGEEVKKASGNRLLYGAHYGYTQAVLRNQAPGVVQLGGHFELGKMLNSPAADLVNATSSGDKRGPTSNYEAVTPLGSTILNGKLPILELDNRTPLTRGVPPFEYYQLFSFDDFLNGARKDVGYALTHGAAIHWYDMSWPHDANQYFREPWYIEDDFYDLVQNTMKLGAQPAKVSSLEAPVAVFIDENVVPYQDVYDSFVYENLIRYLTESLAQAGVGYRVYLLSDYEKWSLTPAAANTKMEVFLNGWLEPKNGWKTIAASPRAQLWLYGSNLLSADKFHERPDTRALLGFDLERKGALTIEASQLTLDAAFAKSAALPASYGNHPYSDFHKSQRQLFGETLADYYAPAEATGYTALARFAGGTPGLTESRANGHQRFFSALPFVPAPVLRALYERAGIRPAVPLGDWWVAEGRGLISINTQATVSDPALLQKWLEHHPPLVGAANGPVEPGQSYVVQANAQ